MFDLYQSGTGTFPLLVLVAARRRWSLADDVAGLLLHPSVGEMMDETAVMQGHAIRFATVDLAASASEIREQLLRVVDSPWRVPT